MAAPSNVPSTVAAQGLTLAEGRYRLVRQLGNGGFGRVWLARDETLHVDVAIKEVLVAAGATPQETAERIERAAREARSAARLRDHPNVVTVHDVIVERGTPWTVMQYVPGRSLAEEIAAEGLIPGPRVKATASALLSALSACHAAGIVHRDVKPANIMMADDGQILLTDFGIAKAADSSAMTAKDMVIGSLEYIAPERAKGEQATPASDLFSLGVTLYHASEGISPFHRGSGMATLSAVLLEPLPAPEHAGKKLSAVIKGLTAKDPEERLTEEQATQLLKNASSRPAAKTKTATKVLSTEPPTATATAKRKPPRAEPAQPADPPNQSPRPDQGTLKERLVYLALWAALFAAGLLVPAGVGVKQTYSTLSDYLAGKTPHASTTRTSYVSLYTSFTSLGDQNYRSWAVALAMVLPAISIVVGLIMTLNSAETAVGPVMTLLSLPTMVFAAIWIWLPVFMDHKDTFASASDAPIAVGTVPSVTPGLGLILYTVPLAVLGGTFYMLAKLAK